MGLLHHGKAALLDDRQLAAFVVNAGAYLVLDSRNHQFLEATEAVSIASNGQ